KSGAGWLVLERAYQDVAVYASFRCAGACKPGVLLRAEKTAGGMKGILVSLAEDDVASYRVTIDQQGKETSRERLRYAGGQNRIPPPPDPSAPAGRGGAGALAGRGGRGALPANLPIAPPTPGIRAGEWNTAEILLDANIVRAFLNDSAEAAGGVADDDAGRYG